MTCYKSNVYIIQFSFFVKCSQAYGRTHKYIEIVQSCNGRTSYVLRPGGGLP